jgi:hypothetical protein
MATSGGGGEGAGAQLGGLGETCVVTSDCAKGFVCMPGKLPGEGLTGVGQCTPIDTGLKPTGLVCGAECVKPADCCELPLAQQTATGAASCADLAELVGKIPNCNTALGVNGIICLAYSAYCDDQCGKNTWSCDGGSCEYAAKCSKATEVVGGCPAFSRGGRPLPACDVESSKCQAVAAVAAGCASDDECDAGLVVADHPLDTCSAGECACDVASGGCYRKCNETLDCEMLFSCDPKTSLCVPKSGCATDTECIAEIGDYRAKCEEGRCVPPPCAHDIDCNPNGLVNGQFSSVCGPDKKCVFLGCSPDDDCGQYAFSGLHAFCGPPAPEPTTAEPRSAITD